MKDEVGKKSKKDSWILFLFTTVVYMMVTTFVFEQVISKEYNINLIILVGLLWMVYSTFQVKKIVKYVINLINK